MKKNTFLKLNNKQKNKAIAKIIKLTLYSQPNY